jgi:hypothetical protein
MKNILLKGLSGILALLAFAVMATEPSSPRITPDYSDVTLPPNIAPTNFRIDEPGETYRVTLRSASGTPITLTKSKPVIQIPIGEWHNLLQANKGRPLYIDVSVQDSKTGWHSFATITNHIASDPIDTHLVYRLLKPIYNNYVDVGIYQRDLESFKQTPLLRNEKVEKKCLNCHTFLNHKTEQFALHTRGFTNGFQPMLLGRSNTVSRVDKTMGYLAWHPNGNLLAFSANKLSLFFHTDGETRDVFDARSHISIYRLDSNIVVTPKVLSQPNRNETWPNWAPDGKALYFSSADPQTLENHRKVRYDIMRAIYNPETDEWQKPEVLISSQQTGLSATEPRVSPDGRWLLFCLAKYGNFPIYQTNSDLYVMDLRDRAPHRLEINSDKADSWHCWSFNSRWIVFSTKRLDGLFSRPFFSYLDTDGKWHKPFILPQEDPDFYEVFPKNFNAPELVNGPVTIPEEKLAEAAINPDNTLKPALEGSPEGHPEPQDPPDYRQAE